MSVELAAGDWTATFLPERGLLGLSLTYRGRELLHQRGGLDTWKVGGHTMALPLLAPWANRLASRRYRADGVTVDVRGRRVHTDANGLPIHGLLVGWPDWEVTSTHAARDVARLTASTLVDAPAFPFPHLLEVAVAVHDDRLVVDTTLIATGPRNVPVAFGWHPYLRVPGTPRARWQLRLPARTGSVQPGPK